MEKKNQKKTGIPRLFELAGQRGQKLMVACVLSILSSAARMMPFFTIYGVLRQLLLYYIQPEQFNQEQVIILVVVTFASAVIYGVYGFTSSIFAHNAAFDILYELRMKLMGKLGRIPSGYFTSTTQGGIKKILSDDVEQIETFVAHNIADVAAAVATPLFTILFLFIMDWRLALVTLIPIIISLFLLGSGLKDPAGAKTQTDKAAAKEKMNGTIIEYIHGMPVIKIFGRTLEAFKQYENNITGYVDTVETTTYHFANRMGAYYGFFGAQLLFLLPAATLLIMRADSYVDFLPIVLLFFLIGAGMKEPLENMMSVTMGTGNISAAIARVDDILDQKELTLVGAGKKPASCDISFENVSFSYDSNETQAVNNVSFSLEEGTINALVGPSGGGKSTIAQLLLHFYEPQNGSIKIGGVDIKEISWDCLTDLISFVFQDSYLFADTIENNIRMGNTAATHEDVIAAAKNANIHDVIEALPERYNTLVGDDIYLSGGEKQRIAIARVFLKDSPIVVLDEATAYADAENETKIQEAFARLSKSKTVLIIAHRLKSIQNAHMILVMDNGILQGYAPHKELLEQCALYQSMVDANERRNHWTVRKVGEQ
ncbi:MAG: ABC transporter ATP-binding protein [Suipraeoptans sp.]